MTFAPIVFPAETIFLPVPFFILLSYRAIQTIFIRTQIHERFFSGLWPCPVISLKQTA
jgi:hypothetical protein